MGNLSDIDVGSRDSRRAQVFASAAEAVFIFPGQIRLGPRFVNR